MRRLSFIAATLFALGAPGASAQPYSQVIVFGDSNVDSGFYRALPNPGGSAAFNAAWSAAVAAGAGAPVSRPGPMNSELLASYFGLTAAPSNTPGGTNYASSGAKNVDANTAINGGFLQAIPTATQIANYLSANGNQASPTALFYIFSGANDASFALGNTGAGPYPPDPTAHVQQKAAALVPAIVSLKNAGAQKIVVATLAASYPTGDPTAQAVRAAYNQALVSGLTSQNVTFIEAKTNDVRLAISARPSAFGFSFVNNTPSETACVKPSSIAAAWSLLCTSAPGTVSTFANANADMTRLFADDGHLATAGQTILANYIYGLLPQPTSSPLVAAVLPASRSVQVGSPATAFATIVNSGTAALGNCQFSPVTNVNGRFTYQTTNSANALTGAPNTPVSIPAGGAQSFLLAFAPTAPFAAADVKFSYACAGANPALPIVGVNTIKLVFDASPVPDLISVGVTPSNDGFARTGGSGGTGLFVVSAVNIGSSAAITARARVTGTSTPIAATVCQTNSSTGQCLAPAAATATKTIATGEITTWGAFLQASGAVAPDPATNRVFFEFVDAGGIVRGSTSTAVTTQ